MEHLEWYAVTYLIEGYSIKVVFELPLLAREFPQRHQSRCCCKSNLYNNCMMCRLGALTYVGQCAIPMPPTLAAIRMLNDHPFEEGASMLRAREGMLSALLLHGRPVLDVQQPWFDQICSGNKTVEGRTGALGRYDAMIGQIIDMYDPAEPSFRFPVLIVAVRHYDTLNEYIDAEGWQRIAPHTGSNKNTMRAYADIYMPGADGPVQVFSSERVAQRGGINAIEVERLD